MKKLKIVIANSVGRDETGDHFIHFPSRWTSVGKGHKSFTYYPYELAYLSSILKQETDYQIKMFDGNLLQLDYKQYFDLIKEELPDYLIMETSTAVYNEDLKLAKKLKGYCNTKIIFAGQHSTAMPEKVLKDGVDLVCLGEFENTLLEYFTNGENSNISGIYPNGYNIPLDINILPFPEDEDIKRNQYYYIGGSDYREIEFFATRGCPIKCNYCVCGNLYYKPGVPNYRIRAVQSIIDEIKYLKNKYPEMEGIFYDEEYHNVNKQFILDLCEAKIKNNLNHLKYNAMCGYWTLDEEMLLKMKEAGYYKLRLGIETVSDKTLKAIWKNIDVSKLENLLRTAKRIGMKMYGTFMFGALGSDDIEDKKTLGFIKKCLNEGLLDEYQISVCTPQPGTPFFKYLKENNLFLTEDFSKYDGGGAVFSYPDYSNLQIEKNYQEANRMYVKSRIFSKKIFAEFVKNVEKHGLMKTLKYGARIIKRLLPSCLFWKRAKIKND